MPPENGERPSGPLELSEVLYIETKDGAELPFEVVGILEDPEEHTSYAVLVHEPEGADEGEFIVTDMEGNLVEDDELAQEILDEFLVFAEEAGDEGGGE
ncbi:MAG TPA: hypothetical protein VMH02_07960 [Verrucomicrobiae bacterium]|nr:hypothetical protein [Verrucomicrobiae bacterium]